MLTAYCFLELGHMKNRVNRGRSRKLQTVGNGPNTLNDTKGAKKLECQLLVSTVCQGRLHIGL